MLDIIQGRGGLAIALVLAGLSGLTIRIMLTIVKQKWVATYHHTMSYILLPLITFTITKVITGNIALSLGMIGALSIVRFRNPVKNPFELVIFFALVTIGISMAAKIEYGIMLAGVINLVILMSYLIEKITKRFNLHMYSLSFDEGNSFDILEVTSSAELSPLSESQFLLQYVYDKKASTRHYRLASRNSNRELDSLRECVENDDSILLIESRYS